MRAILWCVCKKKEWSDLQERYMIIIMNVLCER